MPLATKIVLGTLAMMILSLHAASYASSRNSSGGQKFRVGTRAAESLLIAFGTAFLSNDVVHSDDEKSHVGLGWPMDLVIQDQYRFDPPYPWPLRWAWEVPTHVDALGLLVSWAFWAMVVFGAHYAFDRVREGGLR